MSSHTALLLTRLKVQYPSPVISRLRTLLRSPDVQVLSSPSAPPLAGRVVSLWKTRQQISEAQGDAIDGLSGLLARLDEVPSNRPIEQFGVVGTTEAGTLFFDAETDDYLGAVLVKMSAHTRAYFRGALSGSPVAGRAGKRQPMGSASPSTSRTKSKRALA